MIIKSRSGPDFPVNGGDMMRFASVATTLKRRTAADGNKNLMAGKSQQGPK